MNLLFQNNMNWFANIKMSLRRIGAMAWKEMIHIKRDFRTLYLSFALPVLMILIFGYAVEFDVDKIRVGINDRDRTEESRQFISKLISADWFRLESYEETDQALMQALDQGKIKVAIFIPEGFSKSIKREEQPVIQAILDGSDNNAASVSQNYLLLFGSQYSATLQRNQLNRAGVFSAKREFARLSGLPFIYYNPELKSRFYVLPGIIALTTAILAALLTSLVIAREWERGTMEQLIATPVRPFEIVIGKLVPYTAISLLQTGLTTLLAVIVFKVPFEGNFLWLIPSGFLFAVGTLGLGVMLSSILKSQLPAMQAAFVATMLPGIILSNFVFPIESMPALIQLLTYTVSSKYFLVILRTLFLKGSGLEAFAVEMLWLLAFAALMLFVAILKLVKKVNR